MATQTRNPTSDEAVTGTWSGVAGSRWTLVDDYPSVATNDLLTGGTTAAVITFGFSAFSIPSGSTDISVQVQYFDGEAANGANNCGGRVKVGGSYFNASTHNPAGTAGTSREDNWATNPKTAVAWTVDDVNGVGANALQAFGMNSTDSNPTWRFSSIQAQVTYTEPVAEILGDAAIDDAADAVSADATVDVQAASATTDSADSVTASGTVQDSSGVTGDAEIADAADGVGASGAVAVSTTASATDTADTTSASVAVAIGAAAAVADSADGAASATAVAVSVGAAVVDGQDSSTAAGAVVIGGAASVTDAGDAVAGTIGEQATPPVSNHDHGWCIRDRNRRVLAGRHRRHR